MAPKVIVAGHICLDLIPQLFAATDLRPGSLVQVGPAALSAGGAVANTGLALHRLGVPVRLIGKVGDDLFGRALCDLLRAHDPSLAAAMVVCSGDATSYSVVISPPGMDRSFLHCPGANDTFGAADVDPTRLGGAKIFHFGYPPLMRRMFHDEGIELGSILASVRKAGLVTSLDLSFPDPDSPAGRADWPSIFARILPSVDIFLPSMDELLLMLNRTEYLQQIHDGTSIDTSLSRLRSLADTFLAYGAAIVGLKLGDQGLYLKTSTDSRRIRDICSRTGCDPEQWIGVECLSPCFTPATIAGTTGSGDCTIAGFLAAVIDGKSAINAATFAAAVGAFSVERVGATEGVPASSAVHSRLSGGWKRQGMSIPLPAGTNATADRHGTLRIL